MTPLIKIDVAAALLGGSVAKLFELAEGSATVREKGLMFVFNFATNPNGPRRDLRFWSPEIEARAARDVRRFAGYQLQQVIGSILPEKRQRFHAGELDRLFQIRHNTRLDLHAELRAIKRDGRHTYSRATLADFLKRRWLGATHPPTH